MASAWLWQGGTEAPTHCVLHYPSAPPMTLPPLPCNPHASSSNTYSFPTSYGFASMAPPYTTFSTQCVQVTFVKPRVPCEQQQTDESCATTIYQPFTQPHGPGLGPLSGLEPALGPSQPPTQAPTVILVPSSAPAQKSGASLSERGCDSEGKNCYARTKRLCRIRPKWRMSQQTTAQEKNRRITPLRTGVDQRGLQEWTVPNGRVVLTRPRRVTKRVGVGAPQPYHRRRKSYIQRHMLQIPGYSLVCRSLNRKTQHHYAILVADYEKDVMTYLLEVEQRHQRTHNYLTAHPSVSQRTRAILVDWLIQVQSYLGVSQETLYQAVAMVDRVLEGCSIPVQSVQLLAVTCLLIASKLEEQQPVETSELLNLTLNSYTHEELLSMERLVLRLLKFSLTYADPTVFLGYFLYLTCNTQDLTLTDCCGFLMEVVMVESWPLETRPSLLAAAALHGALMVIHGTLAASAVPLLMPKYFNLTEEAIVATSLRLLEAFTNRFHLPFQGAEGKYASESRHCALARHPRLQPLHLLSVIGKVRTTLTYLREENPVIRESQHTDSGGPASCPHDAAPLCTGNAQQHPSAAAMEHHALIGCEERGGLLLLGLEEG